MSSEQASIHSSSEEEVSDSTKAAAGLIPPHSVEDQSVSVGSSDNTQVNVVGVNSNSQKVASVSLGQAPQTITFKPGTANLFQNKPIGSSPPAFGGFSSAPLSKPFGNPGTIKPMPTNQFQIPTTPTFLGNPFSIFNNSQNSSFPQGPKPPQTSYPTNVFSFAAGPASVDEDLFKQKGYHKGRGKISGFFVHCISYEQKHSHTSKEQLRIQHLKQKYPNGFSLPKGTTMKWTPSTNSDPNQQKGNLMPSLFAAHSATLDPIQLQESSGLFPGRTPSSQGAGNIFGPNGTLNATNPQSATPISNLPTNQPARLFNNVGSVPHQNPQNIKTEDGTVTININNQLSLFGNNPKPFSVCLSLHTDWNPNVMCQNDGSISIAGFNKSANIFMKFQPTPQPCFGGTLFGRGRANFNPAPNDVFPSNSGTGFFGQPTQNNQISQNTQQQPNLFLDNQPPYRQTPTNNTFFNGQNNNSSSFFGKTPQNTAPVQSFGNIFAQSAQSQQQRPVSQGFNLFSNRNAAAGSGNQNFPPNLFRN